MGKDSHASDFVSENGTDLCVNCLKDTMIPIDTPVDARENYVDGAGQLCEECNDRIYAHSPLPG